MQSPSIYMFLVTPPESPKKFGGPNRPGGLTDSPCPGEEDAPYTLGKRERERERERERARERERDAPYTLGKKERKRERERERDRESARLRAGGSDCSSFGCVEDDRERSPLGGSLRERKTKERQRKKASIGSRPKQSILKCMSVCVLRYDEGQVVKVAPTNKKLGCMQQSQHRS